MFDHLIATPPAIAEMLTVPLFDVAHQPLGTLWVAHHDSTVRFHRDHVRIVEQLAAHLVLALKLQQQASDCSHALAVFASHQLAQQNLLMYDLYEERSLRQQAEIENQQALRFKNALIDEVNHRSKNTLQVALNLLTMQARAASSAEASEALLESAARLHMLAKVHELLYANANATSKQSVFMPQLLQSLGDALRQSFGHASAHVALEIECDPMELRAQDAIALALLANEVITNAYKHAFPNESVGVITVKLQRTRESAISLRIEDTGSGSASPGNEGMGLMLIRTFAAQLSGALDITSRGVGMGTVVTLTIAPLVPSTDAPKVAA